MTLPPHIAWLQQHAPGLPPGETGQLIQTHISFVVLAGERVYKVKKPVDFGFLDFTTLDKRQRMCEAEVRLNGRLSPDVYLGVAPIRAVGDTFALDLGSLDSGAPSSGAPDLGTGPPGSMTPGGGDVIDYAVVMRRLPAHGMLDAMLAHSDTAPGATAAPAIAAHARAIAELVARFHLGADRSSAITEFGSRAAIETNWTENFDQTEAAIGHSLDRATFDALRASVTAFLDANEDLLQRRREDGWIRDGHGDLKTTAVAFEDPLRPADSVRILDCIEFNDRMRYGDVANDLAFLCMDFESRGRPDLSDELLARYLAITLDADLSLLLPFYECYRAYVIAKISTFAAADPHVPPADREAATENARRHFQLARSFAERAQPPRLIVVAGPSGSGKSTLATALAGRLGARWLSSDIARKRLAGLPPTASTQSGLGAGLYDAAGTARTYDALLQEAEASLARGQAVILDATFTDPAQRDGASALASRFAVPCDFLVCETAEDIVRERLRLRAADAAAVSEGTWEVYLAQRDRFADVILRAPCRIHRIDTGRPLADSVPAALRALASPQNGQAQTGRAQSAQAQTGQA